MIVRNGTGANTNSDDRFDEGERSDGVTYQELLSLGRGGSANISIAVARGIGGFTKLVILKSIRDELSAQSDAAKMFMDEARVSARLNHPNVVQVHEVFLRRGAPVIVMEYLDGQSLGTVMARAYDTTALSTELAVAILTKVLSALHYAHTLRDFSGNAMGVIHRDVSPQNVMVTYDGQVKLVDFGVAKLANAEHQTRTGIVKGRLTYMAPEQFLGHADCRADLFAVGVILWESAARRRFWGDLPEPVLLGRLVAGDLPDLTPPPEMDPLLAQICARALAPDADDRYPTAAAMQEDLERYLMQRGAVVTQAAIGQLVADTCAATRAQVHGAIREQLAALGLSLTGTVDVRKSERRRPKNPAKRRGHWQGPLLGAALATAALAVARSAFPPTQAAPPAASAPPPATDTAATMITTAPISSTPLPAAEPMQGSVRINASAQPPAARWYLDGRKLDSNPLSISFPKDDAAHILRAEAEGYEVFSRSIRFEADADITVALPRASTASGAERGAGLPHRRAPHRRPSAAAAMEIASAAEPAPAPPPVAAPAATKPPQELELWPVEFGDRLPRPGTNERERLRIDSNYPSGH
jgi:tRNA A-37 threonylcarbamoyl transferase component Bud32